jgi:LEA14-like dessication related protein
LHQIESLNFEDIVKKYLIIILLSLPLVFSGCSKYEEIKLINIKDVTYQEFKGNMLRLAITATVHNPNRFAVKIKNANMDLKLNDRIIGTVSQIEQVELAGRKQADYKLYVSIEIKDMLSNLTGLFRVLMNDTKNLSLSGSVHVKSFMYNKTIQVERLSFQ